ncbi:Transposase [Fodinibius roseus]|uniref:Transposase n=1 Tax=Fodinibius roseus TaxID=1194090 RepID=A0A1M5LZ29_9BACT|nr:IS110 family transposase [Fodinibius roseus]SHG70180.1 Transposase [Fodinibius roseus]
MTYVGIDLHTTNMVNVAINSNGEVIREAKLLTSTRSLEDFLGGLEVPIRAVVECTSNWYWLSDWCRANGVDLTLAHAKMVKAISYAKVKTDKVGAKTLAELLQADLIPEAYQIKRELTRGRLRMIQWREKLQSALWGQAIKYNVQITDSQCRQLDKLQTWLQSKLPPAANRQAELLIAQLSQLQGHIHRIEEEIEKQVPFEAAAERLMDVPGLEKVRAWTIMAEIGDIQVRDSLSAIVGWYQELRSGGSHRHKSGNKDGNKYLRAAFGQAAVSAYTHYKGVKKFYRKIKRRSGRPIARAVVGKELAKGVWHMLTKNQGYKGFKGQPVRAASGTCWPQPINPNA